MNSVLSYLEETTRKNKNKIAVIEESKKITYEELSKYSMVVGSHYAEKEYFSLMDCSLETSCFPQLRQNFAPSRFSVLHSIMTLFIEGLSFKN